MAVAGVGVLIVALAAPALARRYDAGRDTLPFEDLRRALSENHDPVAFAGFCQMYALYGPTLDRRVEYLTGDDERLSRPLAASFSEWVRSLRSHDVRAVVLGSDICFSELDLPYRRWVRDHPELFELVTGDLERGVYRLRGNARQP